MTINLTDEELDRYFKNSFPNINPNVFTKEQKDRMRVGNANAYMSHVMWSYINETLGRLRGGGPRKSTTPTPTPDNKPNKTPTPETPDSPGGVIGNIFGDDSDDEEAGVGNLFGSDSDSD